MSDARHPSSKPVGTTPHGHEPPAKGADASPKSGAYVVRDRRSAAQPPSEGAATPPTPTSDELATLKQEAQQAKEQYLRTLAEFENTKKRLQREKEEFLKYASETIVRELLPIVDSLDHALVAVDKQADPQAVIKGVHLIYRQLLGLLDQEGVKRIPTVGERFDPHLHEAVAQVDAKDGQPDGMIVEEVQVGYTMHGKVVRPAMVKVAKRQTSGNLDPQQD